MLQKNDNSSFSQSYTLMSWMSKSCICKMKNYNRKKECIILLQIRFIFSIMENMATIFVYTVYQDLCCMMGLSTQNVEKLNEIVL